MYLTIRRALPLALALVALSASAQEPQTQTPPSNQELRYFRAHGLSMSVGGFGQFTKVLTSNPNSGGVYNFPNSLGTQAPLVVQNQQQYTTNSAGFVTSVQFHPKPWAGLEFNYGFTHYQERFAYNFANSGTTTVTNTATQQQRISTDVHEATGAYQFHPKHIPFQPFVNIGGGALDFAPRNASNQWRGVGLLETGFDVPLHLQHVGFRVEGRSLYYRAPNFYQSAFSTRGWRATVEPSVSTYYRF